MAYAFTLLFGAAFLAYCDLHTDEVPVLLGLTLIVGLMMGAAFRHHWRMSGLVLGAAIPVAETLAHYRVLAAPYEITAALPFAALVAFAPALAGVGLGAWARRLY